METTQTSLELGKSSSFHYTWVTEELTHFPQIKTVLDFGAGNGNLLRELSSKNKYTLYGLDQTQRPTDLSPEINWTTTNLNSDSLDKWNNYFDAVVAVEVIEHLENPRNAFRIFKKILKPGGVLILTTPNTTSFRSMLSLAVRGHYVDFLDNSYPAHITPVVPKDLERMLNENEFKEFKIKYSNRGCVPGWTSVTWQNLSFNLLQGLRFSDHLMVVAKKD